MSEEKSDVKLLLPADQLYNNLITLLGDEKISSVNIVLITASLMQVVEKFPGLPGNEKKDLIIQVLKRYTIDKIDDEEEEKSVLLFIDLFLPSVIDTIISVDKKKLVINVISVLKKCFPFC